MVITLDGPIPNKKNNKRHIVVRGRPVTIPSKQHQKWHENAQWQLKAQRVQSIKGPVVVDIQVELGDKRKRDLDGILVSIMDLLVDNGTIEDDNNTIVQSLSIRFTGYGEFKTRISIEKI